MGGIFGKKSNNFSDFNCLTIRFQNSFPHIIPMFLQILAFYSRIY